MIASPYAIIAMARDALQALRYRANLAPGDADDAPFVCNDPACIPL